MDKSFESKFETAIIVFRSHLDKIRTGRANPAILKDVRVVAYGSEMAVEGVATVVVEDNRTLLLTVWDRSLLPNLEKAILASNLGLNPSTAGTSIRLMMPQMTEEVRKTMVKKAKSEAENCKIVLRNIRRDVLTELKQQEKDAILSEDQLHKESEKVQKTLDKFVAKVDELLAVKEQELLKV